jgi:hypothetical protein
MTLGGRRAGESSQRESSDFSEPRPSGDRPYLISAWPLLDKRRSSEVTARGRDCLRARSYLDRLVTDHLVERLFQPERPATILASLSARRAAKEESFNNRLLGRRSEVAEADERLACLSRLVEQARDLDDLLRDRLAALKAERDRAKAPKAAQQWWKERYVSLNH